MKHPRMQHGKLLQPLQKAKEKGRDYRVWRKLESGRILARQRLSWGKQLCQPLFLPPIQSHWYLAEALLRGGPQEHRAGQRPEDNGCARAKWRDSSTGNHIIKIHHLLWAMSLVSSFHFENFFSFIIHYFLLFGSSWIELNSVCLYQRPVSEHKNTENWV